MAYADARCKDRIVTLKERWQEIETRRKNESEKIKSLHLAKNRFLALEMELQNLMSQR